MNVTWQGGAHCLVCGDLATSSHRCATCLGVTAKEGAEQFEWVSEVAVNYMNGAG